MFRDENLRVSVLGDSPFVTSGFGNVVRMAVEGFVAAGFEVSVLGSLDKEWPRNQHRQAEGFTYYPVCEHDQMGEGMIEAFLRESRPDRVFMVGDPMALFGRVTNIHRMSPFGGRRVATIAYFPIEGLPLFPAIWSMAAAVHAPITYCRFGQEALADYSIRVGQAYHGFDHASFEAYPADERRHLRAVFGFHDEDFLVGQFAVNKRTSRQPAMYEAMAYLQNCHPETAKNTYFYLHCKGYDGHVIQGYDLRWLAAHYGVEGHVLLKPDLKNDYRYSYEGYNGGKLAKEDFLALKPPKRMEDRQRLWADAPYVVKMNCMDATIDISSVHGFNLPSGEGACCGVAPIVVDDGAARTEIYGDVAYLLPPSGHDYWHLGPHLLHVSPEEIGEAVHCLYNDRTLLAAVAARAQAKFQKWTWQPAQALFNRCVEIGDLVP